MSSYAEIVHKKYRKSHKSTLASRQQKMIENLKLLVGPKDAISAICELKAKCDCQNIMGVYFLTKHLLNVCFLFSNTFVAQQFEKQRIIHNLMWAKNQALNQNMKSAIDTLIDKIEQNHKIEQNDKTAEEISK